jgi:hypothetical protein
MSFFAAGPTVIWALRPAYANSLGACRASCRCSHDRTGPVRRLRSCRPERLEARSVRINLDEPGAGRRQHERSHHRNGIAPPLLERARSGAVSPVRTSRSANSSSRSPSAIVSPRRMRRQATRFGALMLPREVKARPRGRRALRPVARTQAHKPRMVILATERPTSSLRSRISPARSATFRRVTPTRRDRASAPDRELRSRAAAGRALRRLHHPRRRRRPDQCRQRLSRQAWPEAQRRLRDRGIRASGTEAQPTRLELPWLPHPGFRTRCHAR